MTARIVVIPGDGIGPEITAQALRVLRKATARQGVTLQCEERLMGGVALDRFGEPLPPETLEAARGADGVLLGAVGGPQWDGLPGHLRPERALLGIRQGLGLYANLRPARLYQPLAGACPLRPERVAGGFDYVVVRELTGGIYFGERGREGDDAFDTERYSVGEIERIARVAFALARGRNKRVTSVDKANVLETSRLWREVVHRVAEEFPDVALRDMLVDNAAMQLVADPRQFDVLLTSNLFGDILSDEAAMTTGSIGLLPSASLGAGTLGLYEPIHGSAPDIAGRGLANPIATILSGALLLRHSLGLHEAAAAVERAVERALEAGCRTADLAPAGARALSTAEMGDAVLAGL